MALVLRWPKICQFIGMASKFFCHSCTFFGSTGLEEWPGGMALKLDNKLFGTIAQENMLNLDTDTVLIIWKTQEIFLMVAYESI